MDVTANYGSVDDDGGQGLGEKGEERVQKMNDCND